ncbi:ATP-dependent zinc metalloprotease FtsH-like [Schistocerca gregaria]|uniref:ATP-dependent zinc metalloprotease FtsH-like n=1 Tax=Schistocerca gregaria TaxID=7010 RepID=UPI00211DE5F5|nr:ATP-dependent zinc metalloprotease FtsH-like [Schistocerca gregaria]
MSSLKRWASAVRAVPLDRFLTRNRDRSSRWHCVQRCHHRVSPLLPVVQVRVSLFHERGKWTREFFQSDSRVKVLAVNQKFMECLSSIFRVGQEVKNAPGPDERTKEEGVENKIAAFKERYGKGGGGDPDDEEPKEEDSPSPERTKSPFRPTLVLLTIGLLLIYIYVSSIEKGVEIYYHQFVKDLASLNLVQRLDVVNDSMVRVFLREGTGDQAWTASRPKYYFHIPSLDYFERNFEELMSENPNLDPILVKYVHETNCFNLLLNNLSLIIWVSFFGWVVVSLAKHAQKMSKRGGGNYGIFSIGKSRAKRFKKSKADISFKNVAGCEEAKLEVMEFVSFLKHPKRYQGLGAKIPKGALLVGPPGTGKTMLAKAVAGEANVPFYSVSGSDFLEMFVGVGPSRMRDLFQQARDHSPCIVFIDEIDAIGRQRGGRAGFHNDERENTLNQLLVEMDGFTVSKHPVVIIAGTNRSEVLDKALLRPGRFDRIIALELPDIKARKDILMVHLPKLKLRGSPEEYVQRVASMTPGFSGADLANVCNEAALTAARQGADYVEIEHFEIAIERIIAGLQRRSTMMSTPEKKTVSFHEAGHTIVSWFLKHGSPLLKVSIVPRGRGLGYAMYIPEEQNIYTREKLNDTLSIALAGRAAEEIVFGVVTTGALDDLEKTTEIAYGQVLQLGMSERFGPAAFGSIKDKGYLQKNFSEETAKLVDLEVRELVAKAYERAKQIITEKRPLFDQLAETLFQREVLTFEDCRQILGDRPFESNKYEEYIQPITKDQ